MRHWKMISLLACFASAVYADDWVRLKERSEELYGGWDVKMQVRLGYQDESDSLSNVVPFGQAEIVVPIYSKDKRAKEIEEKTKFLKQGATLLKMIEENQGRIEVLKEKAKVLQALMKEEGLVGVEKYYEALEKTITLKAEIKNAQRELEAMLKK